MILTNSCYIMAIETHLVPATIKQHVSFTDVSTFLNSLTILFAYDLRPFSYTILFKICI